VGPPEGQRPDPLPVLSAVGQRLETLRSVLRNAHRDPVVDGNPLVSVVLSTYNWSSVLRCSIRSVLWQTYPNLELLVIGDGCTDDSEQVVASFGDERVRWHNLEQNTGNQAIPNNTGIALARGDYVAYQGHDDVWHPRHLAAMLGHIRRAGADFGYGFAEVLGPPGSRVRWLHGRVREGDIHPGMWLPPASIVHRTDLAPRVGGWLGWEEAGGPPDVKFIERVVASRARLVRVPALTAFKFPAGYRPNSYREQPSYEQEAYMRRIERERFFVERELAALMLRRISPLKAEIKREDPTPAEITDPVAQYKWSRRVRGLD
jgi:glycosyltransferase involved in cell wall biosynthesis